MSCSTSAPSKPDHSLPRGNTATGRDGNRLYTRQFLEVSGAVGLFMTGVALQFHFGQYVAYLGHGVDTLGRVVSVALVGTLLIRMHVGRWIDRFGCRAMWLAGTTSVAICVGAIPFVSSLWLITLLRALWAASLALAMTTVPVFAAQLAPPLRRAESIGTIGLAGFLGMIVGPALGDWILSGDGESHAPYYVFFTVSAAFSLLSGIAMLLIAPIRVYGEAATVPIQFAPMTTRSQFHMVRRHWPGTILLVGLFFNMAFCVQSLYLERLADHGGFHNIKVFFFVYCPTAMILRVIFRRLPQQVGRSRTVVGGLLLQAGGLLCLIDVHTEWQLVLPGLLMGAGHCFVFPSMVDLAAAHFPVEHRGTGTALVFAAGDVGTLIGFVTLGELIGAYGFDVALKVLATTGVAACIVFASARWTAIIFRSDRRTR